MWSPVPPTLCGDLPSLTDGHSASAEWSEYSWPSGQSAPLPPIWLRLQLMRQLVLLRRWEISGKGGQRLWTKRGSPRAQSSYPNIQPGCLPQALTWMGLFSHLSNGNNSSKVVLALPSPREGSEDGKTPVCKCSAACWPLPARPPTAAGRLTSPRSPGGPPAPRSWPPSVPPAPLCWTGRNPPGG